MRDLGGDRTRLSIRAAAVAARALSRLWTLLLAVGVLAGLVGPAWHQAPAARSAAGRVVSTAFVGP